MNSMLFLDGAALRREPDDLHALLRDHVGTDRAATRILLQLLDAGRRGEVSHCVVVPDAAAERASGWNVEVAYRSAGGRAAGGSMPSRRSAATHAG